MIGVSSARFARFAALLACIALSVIGAAQHAGAQLIDLPGAGSALVLRLSPARPGPGDTVTLTLTSTLYDLTDASITWRADGKIIAEGTGITHTSVTAGRIGTETDIAVEVTAVNGEAAANIAIIPARIDILWESDSYTPPFYRGRSLPSAGSNVRLQAYPYLPNGKGGYLATDSLTYTWRKDGDVIASGRGKSAITTPGPVLFGANVITVEAVSSDKTVAAEGRARIAAADPVLTLYADHPLFGVMYYQALGPVTFIPETEMTFEAIPYFAAISGPNDRRLIYEWRVNQKPLPADPDDPSAVTVDAAKSPGNAHLDLSLTHAANLYLEAEGSWQINFTPRGGGPAAPNDPFRAQ